MRCFNHSKTEAIGICTNCGKAVCHPCSVSKDNKIYCITCLEEKGKSWYAKHPNWSMVLSWIPAILYVLFMGQFRDLSTGAGRLNIEIPWLKYILPSIWLGITNYSILRSKKSNAWNLLWLIIPFVIFVALTY
jgi:hypothetical protein